MSIGTFARTILLIIPMLIFDNPPQGKSVLDIKFSFGNCLDDENEVKAAPPSELRLRDYLPQH